MRGKSRLIRIFVSWAMIIYQPPLAPSWRPALALARNRLSLRTRRTLSEAELAAAARGVDEVGALTTG